MASRTAVAYGINVHLELYAVMFSHTGVSVGCMGGWPVLLVLSSVLAQARAPPVPRISADDITALTQHFMDRTPVVKLVCL